MTWHIKVFLIIPLVTIASGLAPVLMLMYANFLTDPAAWPCYGIEALNISSFQFQLISGTISVACGLTGLIKITNKLKPEED